MLEGSGEENESKNGGGEGSTFSLMTLLIHGYNPVRILEGWLVSADTLKGTFII